MSGNGLINGHSATISATGAASADMVMQSGFNFETVGIGVLVWVVCKVLDTLYIKLTKK